MNGTKQIPAHADYQAFDAWMLRVLVWLIGAIQRLGAPKRSRLLHRIVRLCERNTEAIVFEMAEALAPPPPLPPAHRPRSAPPGFRVKRIRGTHFFNYGRVRLPQSAGFAARVRRLIAVLAAPDRCIRRYLRLLTIGQKYTRLIAVAPVADRLHAPQASAPAFADSS